MLSFSSKSCDIQAYCWLVIICHVLFKIQTATEIKIVLLYCHIAVISNITLHDFHLILVTSNSHTLNYVEIIIWYWTNIYEYLICTSNFHYNFFNQIHLCYINKLARQLSVAWKFQINKQFLRQSLHFKTSSSWISLNEFIRLD